MVKEVCVIKTLV